jgi:choline dehydrogenase-like flavoprotein
MAPIAFPSDALLINLTEELPDQFPYNKDLGAGNTIGFGWLPVTTANGTRASSWTGYLQPVVNRSNLDIVLNTHVTRVLQTGEEHGLPAFRGVEYAANTTCNPFRFPQPSVCTDCESGARGTIRATREVILSAGAIQTPHILMLSGIGDEATLSALDIDTVIDSPHVGQHLQDHPLLTNIWSVNSSAFTLDSILQNTTVAQEEVAVWITNGTGPLTISAPNILGFFQNPTDVAPFNETDAISPRAGPTSGDYEIGFFVSSRSSWPSPRH